jgi:hypothetical protein
MQNFRSSQRKKVAIKTNRFIGWKNPGLDKTAVHKKIIIFPPTYFNCYDLSSSKIMYYSLILLATPVAHPNEFDTKKKAQPLKQLQNF